MTYRFLTLSVTSLALWAAAPLQAQGLRPSTGAASVAAPLRALSPPVQRSADFIVAVVNSEPITNHEVQREMQRVAQQLVQQRRPAPDPRLLAQQVLQSLIDQKTQIQMARETGIQVEDAAVDQAEQSVARQNQIEVGELHRRLLADGVSVSQFRTQLREQLTLTRLREREVDARVRVSDLDIDQYLREQPNTVDPTTLQINLAQILVAVPDAATPVQVAALQAKAQRALNRAQAGEDFVALVTEFSDAPESAQGGQLGLRTANRYPPLFVEATQNLAVGDVSALVRSGAGFHVLKVVEKISPSLPTMAVTQSRARHILLRPSPQLTEAAARTQLSEFKRRIVAGQADFAALAREHSQDGSAEQGGDLGWASPGMFVPEFEAVMDRLTPGQVSDPLVSRFGVHLIQLTERRKATLSPQEQRETVRAMLREKKLEEAFVAWVQDVRGRAYVELREPPL